ncbi:pre-miRNA 5'-monophosphate methyltransferase-like [Ptychodera flava]|uniref:pre-miRNA 5'-monophosphate methyltransferase-like n=1 Tax=Ptychodera flava TaxID=63121 RepID=UPI00396A9CE8
MAAPCGKGNFHPGAAPFGNFINYYTFNPPENRLKLVPNTFLEDLVRDKCKSQPIVALDVGCNCGDLTVKLYDHVRCALGEKNDSSGGTNEDLHFLGCDLDDVLIQRANESNPYPGNLTFKVMDMMKKETQQLICEYLEHHGRDKFDIVFCFSITMWIHMQNGDRGLEEFLRLVSDYTDYLVIEPQPWKCYKSAVRRVNKLELGEDYFAHYKSLKITGNVVDYIDKFLQEQCRMKLLQCFGETEWKRKVLLYQKLTKPVPVM